MNLPHSRAVGSPSAMTRSPASSAPERPADRQNPAADYLRIAMVEAPERTDEAIHRLSEVLS
jgi:hypothetical protein